MFLTTSQTCGSTRLQATTGLGGWQLGTTDLGATPQDVVAWAVLLGAGRELFWAPSPALRSGPPRKQLAWLPGLIRACGSVWPWPAPWLASPIPTLHCGFCL